jgi:hypothetical protein
MNILRLCLIFFLKYSHVMFFSYLVKVVLVSSLFYSAFTGTGLILCFQITNLPVEISLLY